MFKRNIIIALLLSAALFCLQVDTIGKGKYNKPGQKRCVKSDSTSTLNISVVVGDGSGNEEDILNQTLLYLPHAEDLYSVYNGFFGVTFSIDSGRVHQSRFTSAGGFNIDGELKSVEGEPMTFFSDSADLRIGRGLMADNTIGILDTTLTGDDSIDVVQKSYIRSASYDGFFILEYTIINRSDTTVLTGGKTLFFCDFDVGDFFGDNYTGTDSANNTIYQYSPNDDYVGLALLFPLEPDTLQYGNYADWFFEGSDSVIDSIVSQPFYNAEYEYGEFGFEGDYSSYLVSGIPDISPGDSAKVAYAFAIAPDFYSLQIEIVQAYDLYNGGINSISPINRPVSHSILSVYPNPFNSTAAIIFKTPVAGESVLIIYNSLGQLVAEIFRGYLPSGKHDFSWNGQTVSGVAPSGVYFLSAQLPQSHQTKQVVYLR